jgi:hypothetical protein
MFHLTFLPASQYAHVLSQLAHAQLAHVLAHVFAQLPSLLMSLLLVSAEVGHGTHVPDLCIREIFEEYSCPRLNLPRFLLAQATSRYTVAALNAEVQCNLCCLLSLSFGSGGSGGSNT